MWERGNEIIERLLSLAKNPRSREADEAEYYALFVDFEFVFALNTKGLFACQFPPADEIVELRDDYIAGWDAYIDNLKPKAEFKRKRRSHILRTFNRFIRICEQS